MRGIDIDTSFLEQAGFDASLIEANLRLSPEARVLKHQAALDLAMAFTAAGLKDRGRSEATT